LCFIAHNFVVLAHANKGFTVRETLIELVYEMYLKIVGHWFSAFQLTAIGQIRFKSSAL